MFLLLCIFINTLNAKYINYGHQEINSSCECYLHFRANEDVGFGHRFFEIMLGIYFSYELGCSYVYKNTLLNSGMHGEYAQFKNYLKIDEGEISIDQIDKTKFQIENIQHPFLNSVLENKCNKYYIMTPECCNYEETKGIWCLISPYVSYEMVSLIAKEKLNRRIHPHPHLFILKNINIVWHLRIGDKTLHGNDRKHYDNISHLLKTVLKNIPHIFFFVFECPSCNGNPPSSFNYLKEICENEECHFIGNSTVLETFNMMVQATILITSGSSFADAAAMLTKNIVIYTYHEDRKFNDYKRLLRFINIESKGNLI